MYFFCIAQKKQAALMEENEALKAQSMKHQSEIETLNKTVTQKSDEIKEKITTLNKV